MVDAGNDLNPRSFLLMMSQTGRQEGAMQPTPPGTEPGTVPVSERTPRILRVNVAGQPVEWLSWQEAVCLHSRELVVWSLGETVFRLRGGHARATGRRTIIDLQSIIACDGRITHPVRTRPPLTNRALFRRDSNLCMYCGQPFQDRDLTRDHVVPRCRGGTDHWENVVAACKRCNHHKGNRLLEEIDLELRALPYTPNFAEYLALINSGRILGDQMEFLKAQFGRDSRLKH
jgi:5-methylcytosine-specific restriction endonuclease McrA